MNEVIAKIRGNLETYTKPYGIEARLVAAIIAVESQWDPYAVRYEENYRYVTRTSYFARAANISEATEKSLQRHSFGLMQVMGATARAEGLGGSLLKMVDPLVGLECGLLHLKYCFDRFGTKGTTLRSFEPDVVAAYNAGSPRKTDSGIYVNQGYVDKVKAAY